MRLPPIVRIIVEDLPSEVQAWVGKLTEPINNFMLTVRNGLSKGITVNDNLSGAIKSLDLPKLTTAATPRSIEFSYTSVRPPSVVILANWLNSTDSAWAPTAVGITLKWTYTGKTIICDLYGMNTTDKYSITLLILDD